MEGTFVACRPLQYGPRFPEDMLDLHQVFQMRNEQNDEALVRLRYVASVSPKAPVVQCGRCPAKFTSEFGLNRHGKLRHEAQRGPRVIDDTLGKIDTDDPNQIIAKAERLQRELKTMQAAGTPFIPNPDAEVDEASAAEAKLLDEISPIAWDKTKAAMKADDVKVPEVSSAPAAPARQVRRKRQTKKRGR